MSLLSSRNKFWRGFEAAIFEVVELAIDMFKAQGSFPTKEDDLNRKFYFCLVTANYQLQKQNKGLESPPFYEGNNQPSSNDEERATRESKRPDFQWTITDISEHDPGKSSKQFVLECKRLGKPVGTWALNKNYVNHGIKRFIDEDYGYAYGVESAAMLGYIQNMDLASILADVNSNVKSLKQNLIKKQRDTTNFIELSHLINKNFPLDTLDLKHIWIDTKQSKEKT